MAEVGMVPLIKGDGGVEGRIVFCAAAVPTTENSIHKSKTEVVVKMRIRWLQVKNKPKTPALPAFFSQKGRKSGSFSNLGNVQIISKQIPVPNGGWLNK